MVYCKKARRIAFAKLAKLIPCHDYNFRGISIND